MYVRPFGYTRPASPLEACEHLRRDDGAKVLAGGQSLLPLVNLGLSTPSLLVDIQSLGDLHGLHLEGEQLVIGASTTHRMLERDAQVRRVAPLLAASVREVGNLRVRNRGTIGGSVAHADPAAELPMCLIVLEARYLVDNGARVRSVPAADFATGFLTTRLAPDELLTRIEVPAAGPDWGWGFQEVARRAGDFALVAAAAIARCEGTLVADLRIGLAGVAPRPVRCPTLEAAARGRSPEALPELAPLVDPDIAPSDDSFTPAHYRAHLARVLAIRAAQDAARRSLDVRAA